MTDPEDVQVSLSLGEDPVRHASEIHDETGRAETPGCVKRLRSSWQPVLIAILLVVIFAVIGVLFSGKNETQSLEAKLQHMEGTIFAAKINTNELQKENDQLKQLLNFIHQNLTTVENDGQLKLLINVSLLLAEKTQLSQLLESTLQEKTQLQVEKKELNMLLNSTLENCLKEEERLQNENNQMKQLLNSTYQNLTNLGNESDQLKLLINATIHNVTLLSVEKKHLSQLLESTLQEKAQLQVENKGLNTLLNATVENCHMEEERLQNENSQLMLLLNSTYQNLTALGDAYDQLKMVLNATLHNVTLLSVEKTHLSQLLENTLQEKTQLQVENEELSMLLNSTLQTCNLVEEENIQLKVALNQSLNNITMASAEIDRLQLLLTSQEQTSAQLETKVQLQHSILFSNRLSFLWMLCNNDTLQCLRCLPGWTEHASRCFFLSTVAKKWENARWDCVNMGGDLAVVLNAEDQAFLTNLTFQYTQQYNDENFHSAWIGMQDMVKEGTHYWINGNRIQSDVIYWRPSEPNNAIASWDVDESGQDCVAIVPPDEIGTEDWLNSWDDIVCLGARHYICESLALILS